jgi:hypothetical protein
MLAGITVKYFNLSPTQDEKNDPSLGIFTFRRGGGAAVKRGPGGNSFVQVLVTMPTSKFIFNFHLSRQVPGSAVGGSQGSGGDEAQPRFVHNDSGRFESRFLSVKIEESPSIMLKDMGEPRSLWSGVRLLNWCRLRALLCFRVVIVKRL